VKNQYLKNPNKIEFVVTYACTGHCKHCSEGTVLNGNVYRQNVMQIIKDHTP